LLYNLNTEAKKCLKYIYRPGFLYKKAGIMLVNLMPNTMFQYDILMAEKNDKHKRLMTLMDNINNSFGQKSLFLCAEGIDQTWKMQRNKMSKRYTTKWQELPIAQCR
jgi:DNA polymerase V